MRLQRVGRGQAGGLAAAGAAENVWLQYEYEYEVRVK
eukprot:COSAG01_NODE_56_length_31088_cov_39.354771_17_plen_37_part_00